MSQDNITMREFTRAYQTVFKEISCVDGCILMLKQNNLDFREVFRHGLSEAELRSFNDHRADAVLEQILKDRSTL